MNADCTKSGLSLTNIARWSMPLILYLGFIAMTGCFEGQNGSSSSQTNSNPTPKSSPKPVTPPLTTKNATFKADPNPIQICDGSGLGVTTLTYTAEGPTAVQVRVGSPNGVGGLLAHSGPKGVTKTGKWVSNGMTFYLQDASEGRTLTPDNTLATVTVNITKLGCP